jgi:hypothetical protein
MNDLIGLLKNIAPGLATAVAGPLGGAVVTAIASKFGVEDSVEKVTQAVAAMKNDPQMMAKLQELELEYAKLAQENTANARAMQIAALQQTDAFSKRFVAYLSAFWSIMAVSYIGFVTFVDIPEKNVRFVDTILGFMLGTVVATVLNFWLGSSAGSRAKDTPK